MLAETRYYLNYSTSHPEDGDSIFLRNIDTYQTRNVFVFGGLFHDAFSISNYNRMISKKYSFPCLIEAYKGSRGIAPLIRNLGDRWSWVVNIVVPPLYSRERASVKVEQEGLGRKKSLSPTGSRTPDRPAQSTVTTYTALPRLQLNDWWMRKFKRSARKGSWINRGTVPVLAWRDWGNPLKPQVNSRCTVRGWNRAPSDCEPASLRITSQLAELHSECGY